MLRIKIEIVPFGEESSAREIERFDIGNITPFRDVADYNVKRYERKFNGGDPKLFQTEEFILSGHRRSDGATELCRRILEVACGIGTS